MTQLQIPGFDEARQARDEALVRVADNAGANWQDRVFGVLRSMTEPEFIGEDLRLACESRGIFPHHHNAWGAVISAAVKSGLIEATGEYRSMRTKKSHARKSQVFRLARG